MHWQGTEPATGQGDPQRTQPSTPVHVPSVHSDTAQVLDRTRRFLVKRYSLPWDASCRTMDCFVAPIQILLPSSRPTARAQIRKIEKEFACSRAERRPLLAHKSPDR